MRFLKILFSRTFLVVLGFIIQFAFIFWFAFVPTNYFYFFHIICIILSFIAFLDVINKNQPAEFKLPWLFILLVFPVLGLFLYITFAKKSLSKRQIKNISLTIERIKAVRLQLEDNAVKDFLDDAYGIEKYLTNVNGDYGHLGNKITYIPTGEDFFIKLLSAIKKAKKFIFLEYFIIADGKIWSDIHLELLKKVEQGVEVRIIYDDIGSLGRVSAKFYKKLAKQGIKCVKFNPFRPILSGIHNNRDHRKITVIDGLIGFTGGINIADEYANLVSPNGYWKDCAIKIEGSAVADLTEMFLTTFDANSKQVSDYKTYLQVPYKTFNDGGFVHIFGDVPSPFDNKLVGENTFINLINQAKKSVCITTPYLIIDYTLENALKNASLRGIEVKIITPNIPDKKIVFNVTRSHYGKLIDSGVKIFEYSPGFMHAKTILIDDELAFVGTINLDYRSFVHHFECGAILYKCPCIKKIKKDLEETLDKSININKENYKMNKFAVLINSLLALFFPML